MLDFRFSISEKAMNQIKSSTQQFEPHTIQNGALSSNWLIWLLAFVCVWSGLGTYGVLNNNEGLYANIPLDMLNSGDINHWIIPHLNGLPYMEKPPMMYWLTAVAFLLFGQAEWVVRLVPALSGLACVGLIMYFAERIQRPQMGRLAALMFISGLGVMRMSRTLLFDMPLAAFLTAAFIFAYFFLIQGRKVDLRIAYASLALGVLTKGFVAIILFGLVIVAWLILKHGWLAWKQISKWLEPVSVLLFFVITVPWLVAASLVEPIFPWFFFINEHVMRFLGERVPHDYYSGPWWYYLPRLVIYLFPWSLLLPIALCSSWKSLSNGEQQEFSHLRKMLGLGWLIPLIFFSMSSNKANYYVIVVMPFAALHLALLIERSDFLSGKRNLILGGVLAVIVAATALMLQFFPTQSLTDAVDSEFTLLGMSAQNFTLFALWAVTGLSLLAAFVAWRITKIGLVAYIVLPFIFLWIFLVLFNARDTVISNRSMATFIQQTLPNYKVYLYRHYEQNSSLPFYLKKSLNVIDSDSNDLYWGNKLRPQNTIVISSELFEKEKEPAAVVVPNELVDEFEQKKWQKEFTHSKRYSHETLFY
jgi:4-amino-4-deoxy-L-arabinose transferase-like glycosyltransferase